MLIMNHPCSLPDDIPSARYAMKPREINTENNADLDRGRRFVYVKFEYMPSPIMYQYQYHSISVIIL